VIVQGLGKHYNLNIAEGSFYFTIAYVDKNIITWK
jgi:hypothetical protein